MNDKGAHARSLVTRLAAGAAIVVMALAIAWPHFATGGGLFRTREEARRAECLGNLKQLGLALKQYAQDFRDVYPWHVGVSEPNGAWVDLGLLFPNYCTEFDFFFCPSSKDRPMKEPKVPDEKGVFDPFDHADNKHVISYAYGFDASGAMPTAWTKSAKATVRILADKKAGIEIKDNLVELANHKDEGRNVLFEDGHSRWEEGSGALAPDEYDDNIAELNATDYSKWWSDPPWYGEGMADDEAAEEAGAQR
jgi:hypothetical protein